MTLDKANLRSALARLLYYIDVSISKTNLEYKQSFNPKLKDKLDQLKAERKHYSNLANDLDKATLY